MRQLFLILNIAITLFILGLSSCKTPGKSSSLSEDTLEEKMTRLAAYRGQYRMAEEVEVGFTHLAHIIHLFDFTNVGHDLADIHSIFDFDQLDKTLDLRPDLFFELPEKIRDQLLAGEEQSLVNAYYASLSEQNIEVQQPKLILRHPDVKFGAGILEDSKPGANLPGLTDRHGNLLSSDKRMPLVDEHGNPLTFDELGFIQNTEEKKDAERKYADDIMTAKIAALKARISERWQKEITDENKFSSLPIAKHLPEVQAQVLISLREEIPLRRDIPPNLRAYFEKRTQDIEYNSLELKVKHDLEITDPVEFAQELELISRITQVFRQNSKDPLAHFMDAGGFHLNYSKVSGESMEGFAEVYNVLTMARMVNMDLIGNAFGHVYSFQPIDKKGLVSFQKKDQGRVETRFHTQFFIDEMLEIFDLTSMNEQDAFKLMGEEIEPLMRKIAESMIRYHFSAFRPADYTKPFTQMALIIEALMKHDVVDSSTLQEHASYFLSLLPAEEKYTPTDKAILTYLFYSKNESISLIKQIISPEYRTEYSILIDKILDRFPDIAEYEFENGLDASTVIDNPWMVSKLKVNPRIFERHAEEDSHLNLRFVRFLIRFPRFVTPRMRLLLRRASASPSMEESIKLSIAKMLGDQLSREEEYIRMWNSDKSERAIILSEMNSSDLLNKRTLQPVVDSIIQRDETLYYSIQYFRMLIHCASKNNQAYRAVKQVLLHEIDFFNPPDRENLIYKGASDGGSKYATIQKALKEIQANIPEKSQAAALVLESIEKKMAERGLCSRL